MSGDRDFSDEDLTAYLDGEADPDLAARIDAAAQADPRIKARIADLTIPADALPEAFSDLLAAAPAMPEAPAAAQGAGASRLRMVVAACVAAVLGLLIGSGFDRSDQPDWMDYVAAYQALYVSETLAGPSPDATAAQAQLSRLGDILSRDLSAASDVSDLEYRRGQLLGYDGRDLVQLAYLTASGEPVALCIIRNEGTDSPVQSTTLEGMSAAHWTRDGYGFLLIGGTDPSLIADTAAEFAAAL